MGYQVYEDTDGRWAGYGVPAVCDWPDCSAAIHRGLGYKCEENVTYTYDENEEETERIEPGCGLFFCEEHRYRTDEHMRDDVVPKPDTAEWIEFMLTDDSWEQWRTEHRARVDQMRTLVS